MSLASLRWQRGFSALPEPFFQRVPPTPISEPYWVAFNTSLAQEVGLPPHLANDPATLAFLAGNHSLPGTDPLAAVYAGHQFGTWVPRLGDGRAILLGEIQAPNHRGWELQLKGSGLTRFSRMGDGRAVLRSTIREYLASEAMHGLGVPTTRALAIVGSDLAVFRERTESAAVLTRVAPSFIRFGSFEYFASIGDDANLRLLADYTIERYFPDLLARPAAERYAAWFSEVVGLTATLMADWIAVGFTHGVMNTDNMSILGLTLDYGPYGWLDGYDPNDIPNHTDQGGRYAYGQQPGVGLWNCYRLGEALHPLVSETDALAALDAYRGLFAAAIDVRMRAKIGFATAEEDDLVLIHELLALMHAQQADYTRTFRALSRWIPEDEAQLQAEFTESASLSAWLVRYQERLQREGSQPAQRHRSMLRVNPKYVLRNWVAQEAIQLAETRNYERIEVLRKVLAAPFDEHPGFEHFAEKPPAWAKDLVLSCSS